MYLLLSRRSSPVQTANNQSPRSLLISIPKPIVLTLLHRSVLLSQVMEVAQAAQSVEAAPPRRHDQASVTSKGGLQRPCNKAHSSHYTAAKRNKSNTTPDSKCWRAVRASGGNLTSEEGLRGKGKKASSKFPRGEAS